MFSNFFSKINKLFCSFSYRQRFVFFGYLFFACVPIPTYLVLKTIWLDLKNLNKQIQEVQYQKILGSILSDALKYEISNQNRFANSQFNREILSKLEGDINYQLAKLNNMEAEAAKGLGQKWNAAIKHREMDLNLNPFYEVIMEQLKGLEFNLNVFIFRENKTFFFDEPVNQLLANEFLIRDMALFEDLKNGELQSDQVKRLDFLKQRHEKLTGTLDTFIDIHKELQHDYYNHDQLLSFFREGQIRYINSLEAFLNDVSQDFKDNEKALNFFQASQEFQGDILETVISLVTQQKQVFLYMGWILSIVAIFVGVTMAFCLIKRILTSHLNQLKIHMDEMSMGHLKPCFSSRNDDEFGQVGRAFDKMTLSVKSVAVELRELGKKLSKTTSNIAQAIRNQEFSLHGLEKMSQNIQASSQLIIQKQQALVDRMKEFKFSSDRMLSVEKAQTGLEHVQLHMGELVNSSFSLVDLLSKVEEKVSGMTTLIEFMKKVSEKAKLLSLNSSIEAENITRSKENFNSISQKIQRFSILTEGSTEDISKIVETMFKNVVQVKKESVKCLKDINSGAQGLMEVGKQLSRIAKQGTEQIAQFEDFAQIIQKEMVTTDKMIQSIINLHNEAQQNIEMIQKLHVSLDSLEIIENKLPEILSLFPTAQNHYQPRTEEL